MAKGKQWGKTASAASERMPMKKSEQGEDAMKKNTAQIGIGTTEASRRKDVILAFLKKSVEGMGQALADNEEQRLQLIGMLQTLELNLSNLLPAKQMLEKIIELMEVGKQSESTH